MKNLDYRDYYRRNLPHYQPRGATFLVNSRLAGSLPADVVKRLMIETRKHLVLTPYEKSDTADYSLSQIMHNLKRKSAKQANQALGRTGAFWQHENVLRG